MPHASAEAPANNFTPAIAPVPQLDRRPWTVRVRDACRDAGLPPATRGFAVILSTYFDSAGRWSLSIDQLSNATGLTRRQVFVHLKRCRDADLLDVRGGGGSFRNRYSAGPAICPMKAADTTPETARGGCRILHPYVSDPDLRVQAASTTVPTVQGRPNRAAIRVMMTGSRAPSAGHHGRVGSGLSASPVRACHRTCRATGLLSPSGATPRTFGIRA